MCHVEDQVEIVYLTSIGWSAAIHCKERSINHTENGFLLCDKTALCRPIVKLKFTSDPPYLLKCSLEIIRNMHFNHTTELILLQISPIAARLTP